MGGWNTLEAQQRTAAWYYDRLNRCFFLACAVLVSSVILAIVLFLGRQGLATFLEVSPLEFFLSANWHPPESYGALAFILGSLAATFLAVGFGAPLGLAGAIFLAKVAPARLGEAMRPAVELFVGIPSVVYGWIGLTIFVSAIREISGGSGFGLLAAGIILGIMILPTVLSISEDTLRALPRSLEEASYALGATRWQTIWRVLLPAAKPGLLTAVILAMARAIGEAMAVQMVIGNSPRLARSLAVPTSSLTSEIVTEMGNTPFGSTWNNALFSMSLVLLAITLLLILLVRRVSGGGRENA